MRNVVDLAVLFAELARVLRPGGRLVLLETAEPENPLIRAGHSVYLRHVVPWIGGVLSNRSAYSYLPRSMAYLPPPARMVAMLRAAGFADARRIPLSAGITQLLIGTRA